MNKTEEFLNKRIYILENTLFSLLTNFATKPAMELDSYLLELKEETLDELDELDRKYSEIK
jgi:hypothetical protein